MSTGECIDTRYRVQIGASHVYDNASELCSNARLDGIDAKLENDGTGLYCVYVGDQSCHAAAESCKRVLKARGYNSYVVYCI